MKQIVIIFVLLFAACSPHLQSPTLVAPERYLYAYEDNQGDIDLSANWWEMFGDTTLNRLVTEALVANKDIQTAASRIEEARASMRAARAVYLPLFSFGRSASVSGNGEGDVEQQYILEPAMSWELPLFGSLKQTTIASEANVKYAEWQYEGIKLALAAEVATTYFTLLQYRRDLDIAIRSSQLRKESATLIDSLFVRGMASGVNREQAINLVYTAEADVPMYQRAVRQSVLSLNLLLGNLPDSAVTISTSGRLLFDYKPLSIPAGVPSDVIYRRPDMMSAYSELVQAAAKAKGARIARFPTFNLTTDGGVASGNITKIFKTDSWVWSALLSLSQPIYNFGALKATERAAVEQYNQALLNYQQCFLSAIEDVESALVSISTYREQADKYRELVESNIRIANMTNALYSNGLSAYLDVIDAERTLYNSQMQYSNIIATQYINYINLCKALGGGF